MCGFDVIIITDENGNGIDKAKVNKAFMKIKHRGPDKSTFIEIKLPTAFGNTKLYIGFHHLNIRGGLKGLQPFIFTDETNNVTTYCVCNAEIYNDKPLIKKYKLITKSSSDCEVIPLIYNKVGIKLLLEAIIQNEFAFCIIDVYHDEKKIVMNIGRDPIGVRPCFYGFGGSGFGLASELKGLLNIIDSKCIKPFLPGTYMTINIDIDTKDNKKINMTHKSFPYYNKDYKINTHGGDIFGDTYLNHVRKNIRNILTECVKCRLQSDRPLGALLSGGIDSSIICSIASKLLAKEGKKLHTFSIGMPGGSDEPNAKAVAKYCNTIHKHIELSQQDFLDAIPKVINAIESTCITSIRASVGQWLVSKWISENTDIKVLLVGDTADELFGSYLYFFNSPSPKDSHYECSRLLRELYLYDMLRCDRGIANHGIEARVPYADCSFVDYYMSIDPRVRVPLAWTKGGKKIEKYLFRSAFKDLEYVPDSIITRKKEAFSDGCSAMKEKSWYLVIQKIANKKYSDGEFEKLKIKYSHNMPQTKEALYYRTIFNDYFGDNAAHVIPRMWMPRWCPGVSDPSARVLDVYNNK